MNTTKSIIAVAVALAVGLVIGYFVFHTSQPQFAVGAVGVKLAENYDPYIKYNGGYATNLPLQVSVNGSGTPLNNLIFGTCTVYQNTLTIAASSTAAFDCANNSIAGTNVEAPIAGIQPGDVIVANFASTTASSLYGQGAGIDVIAVSASSTNGYIRLLVSNQVGGTFTFPTSASTTVNFHDMR